MDPPAGGDADNFWTASAEHLLRRAVREARTLAAAYGRLAAAARRRDRLLAGLSGLLGALLGSAGALSLGGARAGAWQRPAEAALGFAVALAAAAGAALRPGGELRAALAARASFSALGHALVCLLALPRAGRPDARATLPARLADLAALRATSPPLGAGALRAAALRFRDPRAPFAAEPPWAFSGAAPGPHPGPGQPPPERPLAGAGLSFLQAARAAALSGAAADAAERGRAGPPPFAGAAASAGEPPPLRFAPAPFAPFASAPFAASLEDLLFGGADEKDGTP